MLSHYISPLASLGVQAGNTFFIVLSGFLAMYTWHPSTQPLIQDMVGRYVGKLRKFYVSFLVATVMAIPLSLHMLNDALVVPKVIVNLLLLQTWIPDYSGYGWITFAMPCWFLCTYLFCECMVSILGPIVKWMREKHLDILGIAIPALILIAVNASCVWQVSTYYPLVRLCDFCIGMTACNVGRSITKSNPRKDTPLITIGMLALVLIIIAMVFQPSIPDIIARNVLWSLLSAAMLAGLYATEIQGEGILHTIFTNEVLVFFGSISMELFLFHTQIGNYLHVIDNHLYGGGHEMITCVIALLLSTVFCVLYQRINQRNYPHHPRMQE